MVSSVWLKYYFFQSIEIIEDKYSLTNRRGILFVIEECK